MISYYLRVYDVIPINIFNISVLVSDNEFLFVTVSGKSDRLALYNNIIFPRASSVCNPFYRNAMSKSVRKCIFTLLKV